MQLCWTDCCVLVLPGVQAFPIRPIQSIAYKPLAHGPESASGPRALSLQGRSRETSGFMPQSGSDQKMQELLRFRSSRSSSCCRQLLPH